MNTTQVTVSNLRAMSASCAQEALVRHRSGVQSPTEGTRVNLFHQSDGPVLHFPSTSRNSIPAKLTSVAHTKSVKDDLLLLAETSRTELFSSHEGLNATFISMKMNVKYSLMCSCRPSER